MSRWDAFFRRRTWLRMQDLIATYKALREQRRQRPIDLQAELEVELTCTHGTRLSQWFKCLYCAGLAR
jgi:hypothetical protein